MSGKTSRDKGARFEREGAKLFTEALGRKFERRGQLQSQRADAAADVHDPDGVFWIECKAHRKCNPVQALIKATDEAPSDAICLAVCKDDRKPITVTLWIKDLAQIINRPLANTEGVSVQMSLSDFLAVMA